MICYKYRPYSQRTIELLLNQQLYFPSVEQLNDPLDSNIDIEAEYQKVVESLNPLKDEETNRKAFLVYLLNSQDIHDPGSGRRIGLNGALQAFIRTVGILSLSKTPVDALLWAHYGDSHTGVCLGFETNKLACKPIFSGGEVTYVRAPVYQDLFLRLADRLAEFCRPWDGAAYPAELGDQFYTEQLSQLMRANLLVKSEKWKYEEEYRLIRSEPGMQRFDPEALVEVVLGVRATEQAIATISSILKMPCYSHVRLRRVHHLTGSFDFGVESI